MSIRTAFYPIFGNRINGWFGDLVDTSAIIGTVFGVCTSLGLGADQILNGFGVLDDGKTTNSLKNQTWLIIVITLIATTSVVSGLHYGIRRLSEVTFVLGFVLIIFVMYCSKPEYYFDLFVQTLGFHINHLPEISTHSGAFEKGSLVTLYGEEGVTLTRGDGVADNRWEITGFTAGWTIFYWGWWVSWAPFVGLFLARISKGRTIREFVIGNIVVPTLITSIWFTIMGGS